MNDGDVYYAMETARRNYICEVQGGVVNSEHMGKTISAKTT